GVDGQAAVEDQEAEEAADAGDGARGRPRGKPGGHQVPDEGFEVLAGALTDREALALEETAEGGEVARVALDCERRQAALDGQVVEVRVGEGGQGFHRATAWAAPPAPSSRRVGDWSRARAA